QLRVLRSLRHHVAELLLGIDGAVAVIEQLDRELGEGPAIATQLARLLQCRLPLLGLDAILLVGTILANARDLNEPSHQNSAPKYSVAGTTARFGSGTRAPLRAGK